MKKINERTCSVSKKKSNNEKEKMLPGASKSNTGSLRESKPTISLADRVRNNKRKHDNDKTNIVKKMKTEHEVKSSESNSAIQMFEPIDNIAIKMSADSEDNQQTTKVLKKIRMAVCTILT